MNAINMPAAAALDASLRNYGFTFGVSHTQEAWLDRRTATWPELMEMLTKHAQGRKEGSCFVPALFRGQRRIKSEADQIDLAVLDADAGHTLEEITAAVQAQ